MKPHYRDDAVTLYQGDCLDVLAELPDASVDSVVTDPPYGLEFMGKDWDKFGRDTSNGYREKPRITNRPGRDGTLSAYTGASGNGVNHFQAGPPFQRWCELWATECLRVLKPGGHLLAFGGTRTWHRLACAVEDAGFEIRDSIAWLYGSGFPKSLDVSKAIDKAAGAEREVSRYERVGIASGSGNAVGGPKVVVPLGDNAVTDDAKRWQGWGTALKPAFEPIVVGRKPLSGTVAANVLAHGVGALNIDGCRVEYESGGTLATNPSLRESINGGNGGNIFPTEAERRVVTPHTAGRWPSNVVIDPHTAEEIDRQAPDAGNGWKRNYGDDDYLGRQYDGGTFGGGGYKGGSTYCDAGGASRFFPTFRYHPKAPTNERPTANGVAHPTVKPLDLMRWLVRLVTPPGGLVLEPFAGSGTTAEACIHEHMRCIAIEREADYLPLIVNRLTKPIEIGFNFNTGDDTP
jgi:DNA modification methylase